MASENAGPVPAQGPGVSRGTGDAIASPTADLFGAATPPHISTLPRHGQMPIQRFSPCGQLEQGAPIQRPGWPSGPVQSMSSMQPAQAITVSVTQAMMLFTDVAHVPHPHAIADWPQGVEFAGHAPQVAPLHTCPELQQPLPHASPIHSQKVTAAGMHCWFCGQQVLPVHGPKQHSPWVQPRSVTPGMPSQNTEPPGQETHFPFSQPCPTLQHDLPHLNFGFLHFFFFFFLASTASPPSAVSAAPARGPSAPRRETSCAQARVSRSNDVPSTMPSAERARAQLPPKSAMSTETERSGGRSPAPGENSVFSIGGIRSFRRGWCRYRPTVPAAGISAIPLTRPSANTLRSACRNTSRALALQTRLTDLSRASVCPPMSRARLDSLSTL